jgi:hypothetical protein
MLQLKHGIGTQPFNVSLFFRDDLLILSHVPTLLFSSGPAQNHIVHVSRVGLDLKVLVAQVALHAELVYGRGVVLAHFALLGIVSDSHGDVGVAALAPDVVRHLEADYQDALVEFLGALAKRMRAMVLIQVAMFLWVEI